MANYVPQVGGYNWKQTIVELLRSEEREVAEIVALSQVASTVETVRVLNGFLASKTARIARLYELLNMNERG